MSEMTKLVIDGWPLVLVGEAKEPRILDVDLAERLGYERPRAIRDLIERLVRDQILNDFDICRTARQSSERKERKAGRPPTEYWLTEEAAILVTTRSDTDVAKAMVRTVVHVFRLAAHGQLPTRGGDDLAALTESVTRLLEANTKRIDAIAAKLETVVTASIETNKKMFVLEKRGNATMAPSEQERLNGLRRKVAQLLVDRCGKRPNSAWRTVQNAVETASGFCGPLKDLPLHRYSDVIRALEQLQKRLEEKTDPNQPLPFGDRAA